MKLGMIGLGRMGGNMARRLIRGGHEVVAFDRDPAAVAALARMAPPVPRRSPNWLRNYPLPQSTG